MSGPLDYLTVVDASECVAGQFCARLLADQGARVTLVEPPRGSCTRRLAPLSQDGGSLVFRHVNTGKTALTLDLAQEADRERLAALWRGADVAIVPETCDLAAFERDHPHLVAVQITPFGTDGPLADWQGPEIVLQALSGMMHNNGVYGREPLYGVGRRATMAAGLAGFVGTLAALFAREGDGLGQSVRIEKAETANAMCFPYVVQHLYSGAVFDRSQLAIPAAPVECRDGWVCIWIYNHRWQAVLRTLGLTYLDADPRFRDPAERRRNWPALFDAIAAHVADQPAAEIVDRLQRAQVIAAKADRPSELFANAHLAARGYWRTAGETGHTVLGPTMRLAERAPARSRPAPPAAGKVAEGVRVVELTTAWAGPMAGRILAFFGAESIHVESPTRVNTWRLHHENPPKPDNFPDADPGARPFDRAFLFNSQNINKRSMTVDLKTDAGRETFRALLARADVLATNFRPGTLAKLGLDAASLRAINDALVVVELPAFGLEGPMAGYAALGPTMEMATGTSAMVGYPGGPPQPTGPSYMDPVGGFNAASAILLALIHRARTGCALHVEMPQVEAAMHLIGPELLEAAETGSERPRDGNRSPYAAPHDAFPARGEDQWVVIAACDEAAWRALCLAIEKPALAEDPRFATLAARKANEDALSAEVAGWTRHRDKHEAAALLQAAGVAAAPVQNAAEVARSPYLASRGFFTELTHPVAGRHRYPGLALHLSRTPGAQTSAAPGFGRDNDHILTAIIGLDPAAAAARRVAAGMTDVPGEGPSE